MPRRSRFVAPRFIQGFPAVQRALLEIQSALDRLSLSRYRRGLETGNFVAVAGSFMRVRPPSGGQAGVLPRPDADNAGESITIAVEDPQGTLILHAPPGTTVNGAATASFTVAGVVELHSNGVDQWASTAQLPVGAAGSNPVADDDQALRNIAGATAPVVADNLSSWVGGFLTYDATNHRFDLDGAAAGFAVIAKTDTGAGAYSEIYATGDTVLGRQGSGDISFGKIVAGQLASSVNWSAVLANGATSGANTPEITNGQQLRLDTAGDQSYTGTGDIQGSGALAVGADTNLSLVASAGFVSVSATGLFSVLAGTTAALSGPSGVILTASSGPLTVNTDSLDMDTGSPIRFDGAGDGDYTGLAGDVLGNAGLQFDTDSTRLELGTASNPWFEVTAPFYVFAGTTSTAFMLVDPGYVVLAEESDDVIVGAGRGLFWVRGDTPNVPCFTDDTNVIRPLWYQVSGGRDQTISQNDEIRFDVAGTGSYGTTNPGNIRTSSTFTINCRANGGLVIESDAADSNLGAMLSIRERGNLPTAVSGFGHFYVDASAPCRPYFQDDVNTAGWPLMQTLEDVLEQGVDTGAYNINVEAGQQIDFEETTSPSTPASGSMAVYCADEGPTTGFPIMGLIDDQGDTYRVEVQERRGRRSVWFRDDFLTVMNLGSIGGNNVLLGDTPWGYTMSGSGAISHASISSFDDREHIGCADLTTGATSGNNVTIHKPEGPDGFADLMPFSKVEYMECVFRCQTASSIAIQIGFSRDINNYTGGFSRAILVVDSTAYGDVNFRFLTENESAVVTTTNTGVTMSAGQWYAIRIERTNAGNWRLYIDDALEATHTTGTPVDTQILTLGADVTARSNAARNLVLDYIEVQSILLDDRT